jgi:membrane protease YdiL (CAAX protease family)
MAGHRLRCDCAAWVEVPGQPGGSALAPLDPDHPELVQERSLARRRVSVSRGYREAPGPMDPILDIPTSVPMEQGTLRHANLRTKRRWTTRVILELAGVMAAFWIPMIVIHFLAGDRMSILLQPFAGLAAGIIVVGIGCGAVHYTFSGLRRTKSIAPYIEAVFAAAGFVVLVQLWIYFIEHGLGIELGPDPIREFREALGWGWAFVVIAIFPAVFEEIAFRGLVQGRLAALEGRTGSIVITGTLFALAHGVTLGLPFHAGGGFYLCWLRARCNSLYPCMLAHMVYNGSLLFLHGA